MRMRTALYFCLVASSVALGLTSAGACTSSFQATGGGSSSSATSNSTGGSTGTSGGGGGGNGCQASFPLADGAKVGDGCGIFVSATTGSSAGDGSLEQPFNAFADALKVANGKPIFLCGDFDESVAVRASTDVYGGMSCPNSGAWTYNEKMRSTINGRPGYPGIAVVNTTAKFSAHSLAINASASVLAGSSAIGVSIDKGVQASLSFCEIVADDGHDGADGKTPSDQAKGGVDGATSGLGAPSASCAADEQGGLGGKLVCSDGTTQGGDGGKGGNSTQDDTSEAGKAGSPYFGSGLGDGDPGSKWVEPPGNCGGGHTGLPGATGVAGSAGVDTTLAVFGVLGGAGQAGKVGPLGHGGGGGGGAVGQVTCPGPKAGVGASGGGGGSGGCGGAGGSAPTAGGSSVALLVVGGTISLTKLTMTVGHAGKGGDGAAGQQGGDGGKGAAGGDHSSGVAAMAACPGGGGGKGGQGGPSGGARGGHAVGIAFGETPTMTTFDATIHTGSHGAPGMGADGSDPGAPGVDGACWDFEKNKACGG